MSVYLTKMIGSVSKTQHCGVFA